jgi:hypothetical protein
MSNVMMVELQPSENRDLRREVQRTISIYSEQRLRSESFFAMGAALLIDWRHASGVMEPEDIGSLIMNAPGMFEVRFIGHFMGMAVFATGDELHPTDGLIGWNLDRVGGYERAIRDFYNSPLQGRVIEVDMRGCLELVNSPGEAARTKKAVIYTDMDDVVRSMEV